MEGSEQRRIERNKPTTCPREASCVHTRMLHAMESCICPFLWCKLSMDVLSLMPGFSSTPPCYPSGSHVHPAPGHERASDNPGVCSSSSYPTASHSLSLVLAAAAVST